MPLFKAETQANKHTHTHTQIKKILFSVRKNVEKKRHNHFMTQLLATHDKESYLCQWLFLLFFPLNS